MSSILTMVLMAVILWKLWELVVDFVFLLLQILFQVSFFLAHFTDFFLMQLCSQ